MSAHFILPADLRAIVMGMNIDQVRVLQAELERDAAALLIYLVAIDAVSVSIRNINPSDFSRWN